MQQMARMNHDLIYALKGSQNKLMRVEFASKTYLWNYLGYLYISAAKLKLNLKRCSNHIYKFSNNYWRQITW
jgi:hypothetical protein